MKKLRMLLMTLPLGLFGCETVGPALTSLALAFGQDLIAAASVNHAPRYAVEVESLLVALASQATGMQFQSQLAASGYQAPPPRYQRQNNGGYQDVYASNNPYGGQSNNPYAQQSTDPYGQQPSDPYAQQSGDPYAQQSSDPYAQQPSDPYAQQSGDPYTQESGDPYAQQSSDPYAQQSSDPYAQQSGDPYAQSSSDPYTQQASDPYAQQSNDPYAQRQDAYANRPQPGTAYPVRGLTPMQMDVTILAQRAGTNRLVEIEDGDTLVDGGDDPASGDLLKVQFRTNCDCFVYVIGVDATGYVAQIYPDPEENHRNPVRSGTSYLVPAGREDWWALDAFKGIEQVYFVASYVQRDDIEATLGSLAGMPRNVDPATYRPVAQPAVVPATRGLVKVKARPVQVPSGNSTVEITPTTFSSQQPGNEVVVTRWFRHE